jgi:hypothetical protein
MKEIKRIDTPEPCGRFHPIPHAQLYDTACEFLTSGGYEIKSEQHAVTADGSLYFGLMDIGNGSNNSDFGRMVGLRNSHNKKFAASLVAGNRVFVCDNLSFTGEIKVGRKHTRHILRDLPRLINLATAKMSEAWVNQEERVSAYRECDLTRPEVHDIVCQALRAGSLPSSKIGAVLKEYNEPRHKEFEPRTAWSLFNAVTEVGKGWPVSTLADRSIRLQGQLDRLVNHEPLPGLNMLDVIEADSEIEIAATV